MVMDPLRRNQYLQAIGLDVWVPRRDATALAEEPTPADADSAPAIEDLLPSSLDGMVAADPEPVSPVAATTWESLRTEVLTCTRCTLHTSRTQGVLASGTVRRSGWS